LAFLAARAHCWLMVNLSSTRTPRSLSAELLSSRSKIIKNTCSIAFPLSSLQLRLFTASRVLKITSFGKVI